jgi:hypothetical protein
MNEQAPCTHGLLGDCPDECFEWWNEAAIERYVTWPALYDECGGEA